MGLIIIIGGLGAPMFVAFAFGMHLQKRRWWERHGYPEQVPMPKRDKVHG